MIFSRRCADLAPQQLLFLLNGDMYDRVTLFDFPTKSVRHTSVGEIPWYVIFYLAYHHRKHRIQNSGLPTMSSVVNSLGVLRDKVSWKWFFRNSHDPSGPRPLWSVVFLCFVFSKHVFASFEKSQFIVGIYLKKFSIWEVDLETP